MDKKRFQAFKGIALMKIIRDGHPHEPEKAEMTTSDEESYPKTKLETFCENFRVKMTINIGDIFYAKFPNRIGNEIKGNHFVIAIYNSSAGSPNVTVAPLTSLKESKDYSNHSLCLGKIKGIDNDKESVVMLNQMQCIDKRRLLNDAVVDNALTKLEEKDYSPGEEVFIFEKTRYRLTLSQLKKFIIDYRLFIKRNSQISTKMKLVDF